MALTAENQKALDDLGKMWNGAKSQQEKDNIHTWANAIRNAGGMQAGVDYNADTGASLTPAKSTPPGFGLTPPTTTPAAQALGQSTMGNKNQVWATQTDGGPQGPPIPVTAGAQVGGGQVKTSQSQSIIDYINSLMQKTGQQNKTMMDGLQAQAMAQAKQIAKQKQDALNSLISSLKSQQSAALRGITNSTEDAKAGLEDASFQKYLAARQGMANRGLAGSGIASDQDTRLMMSKQHDLSGIYRDAALNTDKVNSTFGNQIGQVNTQLSDINVDSLASDIFSKLQTSNQAGSLDQAKLYTDLFKALLPYDQMTMKDQNTNALDWSKFGLEQFKAQDGSLIDWAKIGQGDKQLILDQAKVMIDGGKLDLEKWKTFGYMPDPKGSGALVPTAATAQADRQAALDEAKTAGYFIGPNGEIIPTEQRRSNVANEDLGGKKLIAQVNQWTEQNKMEAGRLNLSEAEFGHKVTNDQAQLDRFGAELTLNKDKVQLDALKSQLSGVNSQIRALIAQGMDVSPELANARNTLAGQINSLFQSAPTKSSTKSSGLGSSSDGISSQYKDWITQSGSTAGVKPDVLYNMMMAESGGDRNAVSPVGAKGLMQFMPDTAKGYGVDVNDPHSSIVGATKYMKDLLNQFGGDYEKAVASYNWGQGNVQKAIQKYGDNWKAALPSETKNYLKKVLGR